MTADWARIPYDVLEVMSNRIINEVDGVNRVAYDIVEAARHPRGVGMTETGSPPPPAPPPAAVPAGRRPKAWLPHSILALVLFLPTGLVALVYSLRSRSQWAAGNCAAARVAAARARNVVAQHDRGGTRPAGPAADPGSGLRVRRPQQLPVAGRGTGTGPQRCQGDRIP